MRKFLIGGLILALLMFTSIASAQTGQSTSASVRAIPSEGEPGSTHDIIVSGLQVGENITIRILAPDGSQAYRTTQVADNTGRVQLDIFTTSADPVGVYTIEIVNGAGTVIGSTPLTVLQPAGLTGTVTTEPETGTAGTIFQLNVVDIRPFADLEFVVLDDAQQTVFSIRIRATVDGTASVEFPSPEDRTGTFTVEVRDRGQDVATVELVITDQVFDATTSIDPASARPGEAVYITVSGLEPNAPVIVQVNEGDVVLSEIPATADINGFVILPYTIAEEANLGDYVVRVLADAETLLSRGNFVVEIPPLAVTVAPPVGIPGSRFVVDISGLQEGEQARVELVQGQEVLTSSTVTGNAEGTARALMGQRVNLAVGMYAIRVTRVASETLAFSQPIQVAEERAPTTVAEINPDDVTVTVSPETGPVPTEYTLRVEGLPANTNVSLSIVFDGRSVLTIREDADENGVVETVVTSEATDPIGTYTLEVRADGNLIGSADFAIGEELAQPETPEAPDRMVTITIDPSSGVRSTSHMITVEGLAAGETISLAVDYAGEQVYITERTADEAGRVELAIAAEPSDPTGDYLVRVIRNGETFTSATFTVTDDTAVSTPEPQPTGEPQTSGNITVTPTNAGTEITVSGLQRGRLVTIEVTDNSGTVVATESANANFNGEVTITVPVSGEFSVTATESGTVIASGDFTAEGSNISTPEATTTPPPVATEAPVSEATITIDPPSGVAGTSHSIVVRGLPANTFVTIQINYGGSQVYSTDRTSDANGSVALVIVAEPSDPIGTYEVQVSGVGVILATGSFTVEGEQAQPPATETPAPADAVTITINPTSGAIGTLHTVAVSGLGNGETVDVVISFAGRSVYETTMTGDANGSANLPLVSEASDQPGEYTVAIVRGGITVAEAAFTIEGDQAQPPATETPETPETPSAGSQVVDGRLTTSIPDLNIPFTGEAGDTVIISMTAEFDTYLVLLDQNGNELASNDDSNGSLNSQIGPFELPYSGQYTVVASSYAFHSYSEIVEGTFQVLIENVGLTRIEYNTTANLSITAEQFSQFLTFQGTAGDVISVIVDSNGTVDTVVSLTGTDGYTAVSDDDSGAGFDPEITRFVIPNDGTYTVSVRAFSPGQTGEVAVTVNLLDTRTLDTESQSVNLNSKTSTDILTLQGVAGEVVTLNIEYVGGTVGDLNITVTQNGSQLMFYQTTVVPGESSVAFEVPVDGAVVIRIEDYSGSDSTLEFSVERQ